MAATLREIVKQDTESPTKADENMLLPLAQKMGKIFGRCSSKQVQTELVEGLGNAYGFEMARKEPDVNCITCSRQAFPEPAWCDGCPGGP